MQMYQTLERKYTVVENSRCRNSMNIKGALNIFCFTGQNTTVVLRFILTPTGVDVSSCKKIFSCRFKKLIKKFQIYIQQQREQQHIVEY